MIEFLFLPPMVRRRRLSQWSGTLRKEGRKEGKQTTFDNSSAFLRHSPFFVLCRRRCCPRFSFIFRSILQLAMCAVQCADRAPAACPDGAAAAFPVQFFFGKFETKAKESGTAIWHGINSILSGIPGGRARALASRDEV